VAAKRLDAAQLLEQHVASSPVVEPLAGLEKQPMKESEPSLFQHAVRYLLIFDLWDCSLPQWESHETQGRLLGVAELRMSASAHRLLLAIARARNS
jgi:hypothetical protein